jgi:FlaA1/EpsC-like NDP-sugar epimerase
MSYLQKHPKYKWALALGDLVALSIGLVISVFLLRFLPGGVASPKIAYVLQGVVLYLNYIFLQILFYHFLGLYHVQVAKSWTESIRQLCKGYVLAIPLMLVSAAVLKVTILLPFFVVIFCTSMTMLLLMRYLVSLFIQHSTLLSDKVVIIGGGTKGRALLESLTTGLRVKTAIGFLDDNLPIGQTIMGVPVLGKILDSSSVAMHHRVDFFVMAIENIDRTYFFDILKIINENNVTI